MDIREGDIFAFTHGTSIVLKKILRIEREAETSELAISVHCLTYEAVTEVPPIQRISWLKMSSLHSVLPAPNLSEAQYVDTVPVAPEELVGYLEYLRETDYARFLDERNGQVTSQPSSTAGPTPESPKTGTDGSM